VITHTCAHAYPSNTLYKLDPCTVMYRAQPLHAYATHCENPQPACMHNQSLVRSSSHLRPVQASMLFSHPVPGGLHPPGALAVLYNGAPVKGPLVPEHAGGRCREVGLLLTHELGAHLTGDTQQPDAQSKTHFRQCTIQSSVAHHQGLVCQVCCGALVCKVLYWSFCKPGTQAKLTCMEAGVPHKARPNQPC
jgi:hypothetical protein